MGRQETAKYEAVRRAGKEQGDAVNRLRALVRYQVGGADGLCAYLRGELTTMGLPTRSAVDSEGLVCDIIPAGRAAKQPRTVLAARFDQGESTDVLALYGATRALARLAGRGPVKRLRRPRLTNPVRLVFVPQQSGAWQDLAKIGVIAPTDDLRVFRLDPEMKAGSVGIWRGPVAPEWGTLTVDARAGADGYGLDLVRPDALMEFASAAFGVLGGTDEDPDNAEPTHAGVTKAHAQVYLNGKGVGLEPSPEYTRLAEIDIHTHGRRFPIGRTSALVDVKGWGEYALSYATRTPSVVNSADVRSVEAARFALGTGPGKIRVLPVATTADELGQVFATLDQGAGCVSVYGGRVGDEAERRPVADLGIETAIMHMVASALVP